MLLCRTLLRSIAAACTNSTRAHSIRHYSRVVPTDFRHLLRQPLQRVLQEQTYSPQQLTAWMADGGLQDPTAMQVIEQNAAQHVARDCKMLLVSPQQLSTHLSAVAMHATLLKSYPYAYKLVYMCTITTMEQSSARHAMQMVQCCADIGILDQDMLNTALRRLTSIEGDDMRMGSIAAVLRSWATSVRPCPIDDAMLDCVGRAWQEDVPKASPHALSLVLHALSRLAHIPSNVQISAMVTRFVMQRNEWDARVASATLESIAILQNKQRLRLRATQCKLYGAGIVRAFNQFETAQMSWLMRAIAELGPDTAAMLCLSTSSLRAVLHSLIDKFKAHTMANVLQGLHTLRLHPVRDMQLDHLQLGRALQAEWDAMHISHVARLLEACLAHKLDPIKTLKLDPSKLSAAVTDALEEAPTSFDLTLALRALHKLGIHPVSQLRIDPARVATAINQALDAADVNTVVSLFVNMTAWRFCDKHHINMQRLAALVDAGLSEWNDKGLSIAMVALSVLRIDIANDLHIPLARLGEAVRRHMSDLSVASLLNSLSFMQLHPVEDLGLEPVVLGQAIQRSMAQWSPSTLATTLRSLAILQLDPVEDLGLDRQEWEATVTNTVADKAVQNNYSLSETLWSLGKLEGRYETRLPWAGVAAQYVCFPCWCHATAWLHAHAARLFKSLDLDDKDLQTFKQASTAIHGCVKLHYRPPPHLLSSVVERIAGNMPHGDPDMAWAGSRCLVACFHLAWAPPTDVLQTMLECVVRYGPDNLQMRINTLYATVGLLCMTNNVETLQRWMPQLQALVTDQQPVDAISHRQVKAAQLACRIMGAGEVVPEHLVAMYEAPVQAGREPAVVSSMLQDRVVGVLRDLDHVFATVQEEAPVLDGTSNVDALCTTHAGVAVAVEVNGPQHFFVNQPTTANGATRFKYALLKRQGLLVVPMHWKVLSTSALDERVVALLRQYKVIV